MTNCNLYKTNLPSFQPNTTLIKKYRVIVFSVMISIVSGLFNITLAQNVSIRGTLLTIKNKPLDFATVMLISTKDSVSIQTTQSNSEGVFKFVSINAGQYFIKVKAVGYKMTVTQPISYTTNEVAIDTIKVEESSQLLQVVTVKGFKQNIERKSDRTVVNVAGSLLAAGNNAIDILERAPGVSVDKDGNVSLNGKSGVTIMINNKLTYLSSGQLADLLRSTNGNAIQTIEIISSPSAKYDASGNSGIINIVLKKNQDNGFNGNLILSAAQGQYLSNNSSLTLNEKSGKISAFAIVNHTVDKTLTKISAERVIDSAGFKSNYVQGGKLIDLEKNNTYRVGADYEFSKNNTTGFVLNGYFNTEGINNNGYAALNDQFNNSDEQSSISNDNQTKNNIGININDRFKLDTAGQLLTADIDFIHYRNNSEALLSTFYHSPADVQRQKLPYYLQQQSPATIRVRTAKADYVYPSKKWVKIETGVKISDVESDNSLQVHTSSDNINFAYDSQLSNQFIYHEKIGAGYLNLSRKFEGTSIQLGLRAEYTHSTGMLLNTAIEPVIQHYLSLFPNLFITRTLNTNSKFSLSLSRRIERPNYQSLNPFAYYLDRYTRELGNPFLKPQYANNLELNYNYNQFNIGFNYGHTTNVNSETVITDTLTKISSVTFINLKSLDRYTLSFNTSYALNDWWSGNINAYATYNNFNLSGSPGVSNYNRNLSYNIKSNQSFRLGKAYKIELNGRYQSDFVQGLYHLRSFSTVDAGISHSFWSDKANLKLSAADIFNNRKTDLFLETKGSFLHGYQKNDTRLFRLVFTYNFGSQNLKSTNHQSGADDEKARAGA